MWGSFRLGVGDIDMNVDAARWKRALLTPEAFAELFEVEAFGFDRVV